MRIRNNITALFAQRQYSIQNNRVARAAMRLSSGYRINSAADDPAGLAISEKMRAQIRGLTVASRNCEDAISLVQTAEGAMGEMHSILQRMRELAVQSASDTNDDMTDRAALDAEYQQLLDELKDISGQTSFNGRTLLDGTVDGENGKAMTFTWSSSTADPADIAALSNGMELRTAGMKLTTPASVTFASAANETTGGANDAKPASIVLSDGVNIYYAYAGEQGGATGAEFTAGTYTIVDTSGKAMGTALLDSAAADAIDNPNATDGLIINSIPDTHGSLYLQTGPNSGDSMMLSIGSMTPDRLGISGTGVASREAASGAMSLLDKAIKTVSTERARLGAIQNRLEHKINNLETQAENLTAAESRIRDVDIAQEMTEYTQAQIQAQVAAAILAQANNAPKNVLTLLQNL